MIRITQHSEIYLATRPVDFRKQLDGLIAICEHKFKQSPRGGSWFVFINRRRTMVRMIVYDHNGYWLSTKRLSRGRYCHWPKTSAQLDRYSASTLMNILKNNGMIDGR